MARLARGSRLERTVSSYSPGEQEDRGEEFARFSKSSPLSPQFHRSKIWTESVIKRLLIPTFIFNLGRLCSRKGLHLKHVSRFAVWHDRPLLVIQKNDRGVGGRWWKRNRGGCIMYSAGMILICIYAWGLRRDGGSMDDMYHRVFTHDSKCANACDCSYGAVANISSVSPAKVCRCSGLVLSS